MNTTRITKTYKFEVLASNSYFQDTDGKGNRNVTEMTKDEERTFEFALSSELYEEFEGNIDVMVDVESRTIRMLNFKPSILHNSWETFAFRKKGIAITSNYHIRLIETM